MKVFLQRVGIVEERSITELSPKELRDYDQCHFFAGIGGWPLSLRLAGYEEMPCWTGSPPCQPFSSAGKQKGKDDERHLAPVWLELIKECRPPILFGEQVADAIRHGWLDDLFNALEECGYSCGAAVLPACSVGAPHLRKRLFFGAVRLGNTSNLYRRERYARGLLSEEEALREQARKRNGDVLRNPSGADRMAHPKQYGHDRPRGSASVQSRNEPNVWIPDGDSSASGLADANEPRPQRWPGMPERADEQPAGPGSMESGSADPHSSFWSGADWLGCRDGKFRPVEPGTQPLAHGLPARVGRLRGYGNAIVPQVAAVFIQEFMASVAGLG